MPSSQQIAQLLDEVLVLGGRGLTFRADTPLLGAVPELDSMAVVALLTAIEERFGIEIDDDEISADTFRTFGSLEQFIVSKAAN